MEDIKLWGTLIVSALTLCVTFYALNYNKKEKLTGRSPIYMLSSLIFQPGNYSFPSNYIDPKKSEFILAKRKSFLGDSLQDFVWSLIIDACPLDSISQKEKWINFNKIEIENIGAESVYFQIDKIIVYKNIGEPLIINPSDQNKVVKRFDSKNPLNLYISMFANTEAGIYDLEKLKNNDNVTNKIAETGGELLNSTVDDNVLIDLWKKMEFDIISKNAYNEYYSQKLILEIKDNTYYSNQTEPKYLKNYKLKHHIQ